MRFLKQRKTITLAGLAALAAFLFATEALASDAAAGKTLFDMNCSSCHGVSGKGDGPVGQALNPPPRDFTKGDFKLDTDGDGTPGTDADLKNVIQQGGGAFGGSLLMAPWPTMSDEDIANVIAHIRSLKE
jgi:mono/diheme cytochrome c family protein